MLTEEQIQMIEKELNIKRTTNPDGICIFENCGRPAVDWLPMSTDDGPELFNICKYHANAFKLE